LMEIAIPVCLTSHRNHFAPSPLPNAAVFMLPHFACPPLHAVCIPACRFGRLEEVTQHVQRV
jgi:hypothetical protein